MAGRIITLAIALFIGFAGGITASSLGNNGSNSATRKSGEKIPAGGAPTSNSLKNELQPIMDSIYKGIEAGDYKLYTRDFLPDILQMYPEAQFKTVVEQKNAVFGKFGKPEYLGIYHRGDNVISLWKSSSDKSADEALMTLTVMKLDDKLKVVNFFIQ